MSKISLKNILKKTFKKKTKTKKLKKVKKVKKSKKLSKLPKKVLKKTGKKIEENSNQILEFTKEVKIWKKMIKLK